MYIPFDWCLHWFWESDPRFNFKSIGFFFGRLLKDDEGWHLQIRSIRIRPILYWNIASPSDLINAWVDMGRCLDYD